MSKVNNVSYIFRTRIYWEKILSQRPYTQCFRYQAFGHASVNCNHDSRCVKCAGPHHTRDCTKALKVTPTCVNCAGSHTANYSKCPSLKKYLSKRGKPQVIPAFASSTTPQTQKLHPGWSEGPTLPVPAVINPPSTASRRYSDALKGVSAVGRTSAGPRLDGVQTDPTLAIFDGFKVAFLERNEVLLQHQFEFRAAHSTTHQLLSVVPSITHELNVRRSAAMVLLDLTQAFDSVWHDALLFKLHEIGLPWNFVRLIRSYLSGRSLFVSVGGTGSIRYPVVARVPQGSILGSVLFNIYINDIPRMEGCTLALYADDTTLISSSWRVKMLIARLQIYLDSVIDFFNDWKLTVNPTKTQGIFFNRF